MNDTVSDERKIEILGELMEAKLAHDVDRLLTLYDPDCVIEQPSLGVHRTGHAEIRPGLELFARHFPDYRREFAGVAFTGDTVVSWGLATVTLTGTFRGVEASGERAEVMTFVTYRFRGERIVHEGHYWDLSAICEASGVPASALRARTRPTDTGPAPEEASGG